MEKENIVFNQIRKAAKNAENQEFPGLEKVWSRVEDKLDNKVLVKQNTLWKKIAVAASILLIVSIGYQFLKEDKKQNLPQNEITSKDSIQNIITDSIQNNAIVEAETNPIIRKDKDKILQEQLHLQPVAVSDSVSKIGSYEYNNADKVGRAEPIKVPSASKSSSEWLVDENFSSRGVTQKKNEADDVPVATDKKTKKEDPLYVIDGKSGTKEKASKIDAEEIDELIVLPDPLYIINGVEYTEKELFGPNPTSPYAPLDKQKIETISILQDEKAVSIYGQKGKKGVVIITTKDRKPAVLKGK